MTTINHFRGNTFELRASTPYTVDNQPASIVGLWVYFCAKRSINDPDEQAVIFKVFPAPNDADSVAGYPVVRIPAAEMDALEAMTDLKIGFQIVDPAASPAKRVWEFDHATLNINPDLIRTSVIPASSGQPQVVDFTMPALHTADTNIPVLTFTAVNATHYKLTAAEAQPGLNDAGWLDFSPTGELVNAEGSYQRWPWVKNATEVSALFTPQTSVVDLPSVVQWTVSSNSVNEGGQLTLTAQRTSNLYGTLSVTVTQTSGNATSNDYTLSSQSMTWASNDGNNKSITLNAVADSLSEGAETATFRITVSAGQATYGANRDLVVTFNDTSVTPAAGTIGWQLSSYTVSEGGSLLANVTRSNGSSGAVQATVGIVAGTATAADYQLQTTTVNWADGDTAAKQVVVNIVADALTEGPEYFDLTLSNITGGASGGLTTARVNITDTSTGGGSSDPEQINFQAVIDVNPATLNVPSPTVGTVSFSGGGTKPISVKGGRYRIDGGAWTTAAGTVSSGQTVEVDRNAPGTYGTTDIGTLMIGNMTAVYSVTTKNRPAPLAVIYVDPVNGNDSLTRAQVVADNVNNRWRTLHRAVWGHATTRSTANSAEGVQPGDEVRVLAGTLTTAEYSDAELVSVYGSANRRDEAPLYNPLIAGTADNPIVFVAEGGPVVLNITGTLGAVAIGSYQRNFIYWTGTGAGYWDLNRANISYTTNFDSGVVSIWGGDDIANVVQGCLVERVRARGEGASVLVGSNHSGARIERARFCTVRQCWFSGFYSTNNDNGTGVTIYSSQDILVEHNDADNCKVGYFPKGNSVAGIPNERITIAFNKSRNMVAHGIMLLSGDGPVYGNLVTDPGSYCFTLYNLNNDMNAWHLVNNTGVNGQYLVYFKGEYALNELPGVVFRNNIGSNQSGGILYPEATYNGAGLSPSHMTKAFIDFDYNLLYHPTALDMADGGAPSWPSDLATWQNTYGQFQNTITQNPLFTNAGAGDYSLQNSSPAKNAGTDYLDLDKNGNTATAIDLGAYVLGKTPGPNWSP